MRVECACWKYGGRCRLRLLPQSQGRRERRERKRERGFEKHPSSQAIDTGPVRSGEVTSPCGLYLRSHSIPALVRTREQSARSPSSPPCSATSTSSRSWGGTTRREEFKLAILPSWDLTGSLSYSRFNRDGFCSYSVPFESALAGGCDRGLTAGCFVGWRGGILVFG